MTMQVYLQSDEYLFGRFRLLDRGVVLGCKVEINYQGPNRWGGPLRNLEFNFLSLLI